MTINLMARGTTAPPLRPGHRRLLTVSGLAGVGYSLSWIAGLAVPAPSPGFGASATVPAELATAPVIGGEAEVGVIRAAEGFARHS